MVLTKMMQLLMAFVDVPQLSLLVYGMLGRAISVTWFPQFTTTGTTKFSLCGAALVYRSESVWRPCYFN